MIYIVAFGVGFKCPRKIHLNTQWGGGDTLTPCDFGLNFFSVELGNVDKNEVILVKTLLGKLHGFSSRVIHGKVS